MCVRACAYLCMPACVGLRTRVFAYKLLENPAPGMTHPVFMSSLKLSFFFFFPIPEIQLTLMGNRARAHTQGIWSINELFSCSMLRIY